jgi:Spy/CpxP family protein refolding chaperone
MKIRVQLVITLLFIIAVATVTGAQMGPGAGVGPCPGGGRMGGPGGPGGPMHMRGGGMGRLGMGPGGPGMGKWWKNSALVQKLGISDSQVQQIEKIFQDSRVQLIDLRAALDKDEAQLTPLIEADRIDESQVSAQIDKVTQARARLEKSQALMLLGIRRVLTPKQWKDLQSQGCMGVRCGAGGLQPPASGK